ncbi:MAG: putative PEP-binding protein [bacterium]
MTLSKIINGVVRKENHSFSKRRPLTKNLTFTGRGNGVLPPPEKQIPLDKNPAYVLPSCLLIDQVVCGTNNQLLPIKKEDELKKIDSLVEAYKKDEAFGYVIKEAATQSKMMIEQQNISAHQAFETVWPQFVASFKAFLQVSVDLFNKTERDVVDKSRLLQEKKLVEPNDRASIYRKLKELRIIFNSQVPIHMRQQEQYKDAELYLPRLLAHIDGVNCPIQQTGYYLVADYLAWGEIQSHVHLGARGFIFDHQFMGLASHPYLLAFNRGIPVVLMSEAKKVFAHIDPEVKVIMNPHTGQVVVNVDDRNISLMNKEIGDAMAQAKKYADTHWTGLSGDDQRLPLPKIMENMGSEGAQTQEVGLYRTEDHYTLGRPTNPSLIRQFINAIEATTDIVFRFFDVDKDKYPKAESTFDDFTQGKRGVDFLLQVDKGKAILRDQIRDLLIACDRLKYYPDEDGLAGKKVSVIIPMIRTPEQVEQVAHLVKKYETDLITDYTIDQRRVSQFIQLGAMVETPEAVENIEAIAQKCQVFSIGGNDLTAAVLEIDDRAKLMTGMEYDWLSPKVLGYIFEAIKGVKGSIKVEEIASWSEPLKNELQKHGYLLKVTRDAYIIMKEPEADFTAFLSASKVSEKEKLAAHGLLTKLYQERHKGRIGFCGEMARDPLGALVLTLMGIDSLSMNPAWQNQIKYLLSYFHYGEWKKFERKLKKPLIEALLDQKNAMEVRKLLVRLAQKSKHYDTRTVIGELVKSPRPVSYLNVRKKAKSISMIEGIK